MPNQYISYDVTKTLSNLLIQFLEGNPELDSFYGNKSKLSTQIREGVLLFQNAIFRRHPKELPY